MSFQLIHVAVTPKPELDDDYPSNTNCDQVWHLASGWIEDCLQNHVHCTTCKARSPDWYPTRLLDLGSPDDTTIKLIETKDCNPMGPYIALSYCWGTSRMTVLVESSDHSDERGVSVSIQTLKQGVDQSSLPQTFQDAIHASRKFNVRYLWIDALCILQDSEGDWHAEAVMMPQVYSNSFLTLAADASFDSDGGLFRERDSTLVKPVIVRPNWEGADGKEFAVIPKEFWRHNIADSPLNQRAWVLQERYLSPRVLHFGGTQVLWECRMRDCCESFPNGLPKVVETQHTNFKRIDLDIDGELLRRAIFGDAEVEAEDMIAQKDTVNNQEIRLRRELGRKLRHGDNVTENQGTITPDNADIDGEREFGRENGKGIESPPPSNNQDDDEEYDFNGTYVDGSESSETESIREDDTESNVASELATSDADPKPSHDIVAGIKTLGLDNVENEVRPEFKPNSGGTRGSRARPPLQDPKRSLNGYYIWARFVETYSRSKITRESDRLVAISGLAQEMQTKLGDKYLFGLWLSILPSQILWRLEHATPHEIWNAEHHEPRQPGAEQERKKGRVIHMRDRPSYYRAPSWSWASVEGSVEISHPSRSGSLIKYFLTGLGDDNHPTKRNFLVVTGDVHFARLHYNGRHSHWMLSIDKRGMRVRPSGRRCVGATSEPQYFPIAEEERGIWPQERTTYALAYPDVAPPDEGAMVLCLLVQRRRKSKALHPEGILGNEERISGLFLRPKKWDSGPSGVYQPMGTFDTMLEPGFMKEYGYEESAKEIFAPSPAGWSEMIWLI